MMNGLDDTVKVFTDNGKTYTSCHAIETYFSMLKGSKLKREIEVVNKAGQIFVSFDSSGNLTFEKLNNHFDIGNSFSTQTVEDKPSTIPHFNINLLIDGVKEYAVDVAYRMNNAPIEFTAIGTLMTLSASIGRRVHVRPKQNDDTYSIVPTLWGLLIAPPSLKKSPLFSASLKPLTDAEYIANNEYIEECNVFKKADIDYKIALKLYEKSTAEGKKSDIPSQPKEPVRKRYITHDTTIEALAEIMIHNPNGILLAVDEISGFFATMNKSGREGERAFYLEAFSGKGSKNIDRVGRGSIYVPHVCASIVGTIQPDKMLPIVKSAVKGASAGDGLLQRFQLMVMIEKPTFKYVDKASNTIAEKGYWDLVNNILSSKPIEFAAQYDKKNNEVYYRFSYDASLTFELWMIENHKKVIEEHERNIALSTHLGKFDSLFASIALILFYADKVRGYTDESEIPDKYAHMAWEWCDFLEAHARRIYDIESISDRKILKLEEKIINKVNQFEREGKLPMAYGKLAGYIAGVGVVECRKLLRGKVEEVKGNILKMKDNY